ncbi:MAG: RNA 3'-terminal phosphate cyclase [Candidatus Bathyarchaeia archaeon]
MIEIDGSMMEGGGQLLRMATTYSAIMGKPVRVFNIRGKRSSPGLRPQHYATLKALADLSEGSVEGLELGSETITFNAGKIKGGDFNFDIGTAGSIGLMIQCLAPTASFADSPVTLRIRGGTAVKWSPPVRFLKNVVWRIYREMGFKGELTVKREGFYPKGGGLVDLKIKPISTFTPIVAEEWNEIDLIRGVSLCGRLPKHVARRQARSAEEVLKAEGYESEIEISPPRGETPLSPGSLILLWTTGSPDVYLGSDALGERGKPAEEVGQEAAYDLIEQLASCASVDYHTADNLILPCSLANGRSVFTTSKLTLHTLTAIELSKNITGAEFEVEGARGKQGRIICHGIGENLTRIES